MTGERHSAFTRARDFIAAVAPAKLFDHEREILDNAAEDLLLAGCDAEARDALETATAVLDVLVDSGRWTARMRDQLLALAADCGPQHVLVRAA